MSGRTLGLKILVQAQDQTSSIFGKLKNAFGNILFGLKNLSTSGTIGFDALKSGAGGLAGTLLKLAAIAALVGVGIAVAIGTMAVKAAGDFDQSMRKNVALAGLAQSQMKQWGDSVLSMATDVGKAPVELSKGLFQVLSAGVPASQALLTLRKSAELATIGQTDMTTTTRALTTIMKVWGVGAAQAADMMIAATAKGKFTLEQYAQSIGKVGLNSQIAKRSMLETNAALDVLSYTFPSAAQAGTALSSLYTAMDIKTAALAKRAKTMKVAFDEQKFSTMTLAQQVAYLNKQTGNNQGTLAYILGQKNALLAAQGLTQGSKQYAQTLADLQAKMKSGKAESDAWATTQGGFNVTMSRLGATVQVLLIKIGQGLLPIMTALAQRIIPLIAGFTDWIVKNDVIAKTIAFVGTVLSTTGNIIQLVATSIPRYWGIAWDWLHSTWGTVSGWFTGLWHGVTGAFTSAQAGISKAIGDVVGFFEHFHTIILLVTGTITLFFLPALIKAGVQAVIAGAQITATFVKSMLATGKQAIISGAQTSVQFVKSIIQTGVQSTIAGAKIAASFVANMIKTGVQAVIAGAKVTVSFVSSLIKTGLEGWASAGKLGMFIGSMIATGVQAVVNAAKVVGSFVASMIATGAKAVWSAALVAGSFVVSMVAAGVQAVIAGGLMMASLVPALFTVAAGVIAATWPILLIIAAIVAVILVIKNWGAIATWLHGVWAAVSSGIGRFFAMIGVAVHNLMSTFSKLPGPVKVAIAVLLLPLAVILAPILAIAFAITHLGQVFASLGNQAAIMRDKVGIAHTQMRIKTDQETVKSAQLTLATLEQERTDILAKLKQTHSQKEQAELQHQLQLNTIQITAQVQRAQQADVDAAQQLDAQKALQAKLQEDQKNWFVRLLDDILGFFGMVFGAIGTFVGNALGKLGQFKDLVVGKFQDMWAGITGIFASIGGWFGNRVTDIQNAFSGVGKFFQGIGQAIFNGITSAVSGLAGWFHDHVIGPLQDAWNNFTGIFHGPAGGGNTSPNATSIGTTQSVGGRRGYALAGAPLLSSPSPTLTAATTSTMAHALVAALAHAVTTHPGGGGTPTTSIYGAGHPYHRPPVVHHKAPAKHPVHHKKPVKPKGGGTLGAIGAGGVYTSTTSAGGGSGVGSSGTTYIINNITVTVNLPKGMPREYAREIADEVDAILAKKSRRLGSDTTTSSGSAA